MRCSDKEYYFPFNNLLPIQIECTPCSRKRGLKGHRKRGWKVCVNTNVELPDESAAGVETKKIQIIPEEFIDRIKSVALSIKSDGTLNYRYGPALVLILYTGLREGELLAFSQNGIKKTRKEM